ncbi:MAG: hypothetical protein M3Q49_03125 [Actinomycetota bacterium]|nr:hypothetical protein [Actinomycetota bacterium]
MTGERMLEFRKYGPAPAEEKDPPMCVVTYPEPCGRVAAGEVWALPFCEAHGNEAHAAARLEAFEDAEGELHGLLGHLGNARPARNPLLIAAVGAATVPGERPSPDHGEAIRAAYALREEDTDPDTLAYDYGEAIARDTPFDWHCEAREMVVSFMREAHEAGQPQLLWALEPIREYETVQQELALADMERRWAAPRRAARERRAAVRPE